MNGNLRRARSLCLALILGLACGTSALASPASGGGLRLKEMSAVPAATTWVPAHVTVETGELDPDTRFVKTTMKWDDVSGFGPNSTYEQDFLLDNYDASPLGPGTYLDRSRSFDQTPKVTRWESNLPAAYLDTRLGDGNDEIAYSIGSGQASEIEVDREYFTLIVTTAGDTERDSARLSAQLGHQRPKGCTSTWCSFSDGPGSIVEIFPAWEIPVPGKVERGDPSSTPTAGKSGGRWEGDNDANLG